MVCRYNVCKLRLKQENTKSNLFSISVGGGGWRVGGANQRNILNSWQLMQHILSNNQ